MSDDAVCSLLVDDNHVFRAGLHDYLEKEGITVIGETDDPETAWMLIETDQPHLILLFSCLPSPMGGLPLCERIVRHYPEIKVVLTDPDPATANNLGLAQAFQAGARACLPRSTLTDELFSATLYAVLAGQRLFVDNNPMPKFNI